MAVIMGIGVVLAILTSHFASAASVGGSRKESGRLSSVLVLLALSSAAVSSCFVLGLLLDRATGIPEEIEPSLVMTPPADDVSVDGRKMTFTSGGEVQVLWFDTVGGNEQNAMSLLPGEEVAAGSTVSRYDFTSPYTLRKRTMYTIGE